MLCEFLEQEQEQILVIFNTLIGSDDYPSKVAGLRILNEVFVNPNHKTFSEFFLSEKENLKVVCENLNAEEQAVKLNSFQLMRSILNSHLERGHSFLQALKKNGGLLKEWVIEFSETMEDDEEFQI